MEDLPWDNMSAEENVRRAEPGTGESLRRRFRLVSLGLFILAAVQIVSGSPAFAPGAAPRREFHHFAPYIPTPWPVVEKMLEVAEVGPDDIVYDLGSGDGRIVIMAAQKFGARAVGVEIDPRLSKESEERVKQLGLDRRVKILQEDIFATSVRPATVVTLFLRRGMNEELRPILERELRPGTRIVAQEFDVPGWTPQKIISTKSDDGLTYTIFLYVRP
jgi:precorrin-6B methylase 2